MENKKLLTVKVELSRDIKKKGYKIILDCIPALENEITILQDIDNIVSSIYEKGIIYINYNLNLFDVVLTKDLKIIYGSDQKANIFELYSKPFNRLTEDLSAVFYKSVKENTNNFM